MSIADILSVISVTKECQGYAEEIARQLGLRNITDTCHSKFQLLVAEDGLSIKKAQSTQKPLKIDFNSSALTYRRKQANTKNEMIARAVGLGKGRLPAVIDATAGLGRDSFILASLGCTVTMLERSPVLALLLADGLSRASELFDLTDIISRMTLNAVDSGIWIDQQPTLQGYVVYLDPMFPDTKSKALSGGDMQIMHEIIGIDEEFEKLYELASHAMADRIVLKRPRRAVEFKVKPTFILKGKSSRFDVFVR
jgi:16S rRNA (guanine1516-N2)-methyltransferase